MSKLKDNQMFRLLVFLGLFGLSLGLFDNYRDLWMSMNDIDTTTISHVISISYIVTVLSLFFFTLKVSTDKLKKEISVVLVLKLATGIFLVLLNGSSNYFWIKFLMFFNIAFTQLILSSIYPLMMNIAKDDVLYAKRSLVESLSNKLGFLLASILVGKMLFNFTIDYNICLILSLVFAFLSLIVLQFVHIQNKNETKKVDVKETIKYFNRNKTLYLYFAVSLIGSIVWSTVLGMPLLSLTKNLHFSSTHASFLILGLGIISNILSMIVVKHLKSKNDYVNLFFKYGARVILYILTFITGNSLFLLITMIYLLLTDCTYNFIFGSFFINSIDEKYSLLFTVLKYCTSLIGDAIGIFSCGLVFNQTTRLIILPTVIISLVHLVLACILVKKKNIPLKN